MFCRVFRDVSILLMTFWMFTGCAGVAHISFFDGVCGTEFERCMARCQVRADSNPCEMQCRFRGKLCSRSQSLARTSGRALPTHGLNEHVELIDLSTFNPLVSDGFTYVASEHVARVRGSEKELKDTRFLRILPPGASITAELTVPQNVDNAELVIRHGPSGHTAPCLVTISVDDQVIAGRYSPPRTASGHVSLDRWDISRTAARMASKGSPKTLRLVVLNNEVAGSQDSYRISSIEVYFQVSAPGRF